ncbi:MAG: type II toxin-antitoxin system VapC family toxin [Rhodocyclaceae bacterium]|nr:type II toxin-antitoxin system VapC family toxin [Rhodocyclaceae bacterium]
MILLDTNVLSEAMRPEPSPTVLAWMDAQSGDALWVCAVTQAEIGLGVALLPLGRRRQALADAAARMFEEDFSGRCLAFDQEAAVRYSRLVLERRLAGRPISFQDAMIAAIALANDMVLATRNVRDFAGISGLEVLDPWLAAS